MLYFSGFTQLRIHLDRSKSSKSTKFISNENAKLTESRHFVDFGAVNEMEQEFTVSLDLINGCPELPLKYSIMCSSVFADISSSVKDGQLSKHGSQRVCEKKNQ